MSESPSLALSQPAQKLAYVAGILVGSCLLLLLALSFWNFAVTKWQHLQNPVPGNLYTVEGRQMHLYCAGTGSPTIIIEAASGADYIGWQGVQARLSQLTEVCTYDRSGLGWSEPRSGPRDAEAIARQLHALLDRAGVQGRLVLTGHSAGGLYVREYAREFPAEVAGLVLIESSVPQQIDELPGFRQSYEADKRDKIRQLRWEELRVWSGWERLTGRCHETPAKELQYLAGQYDAEMCRPTYEGGDVGEFMDFETAANQAKRLTSFGNAPLLVISEDTGLRRKGMTANAIAQMPVWDREQESLKQLSPFSWRVIARDSGHFVHHDRPDVLVTEMTHLIDYLRGGPAPAFGSTVIE